MFHHEDSIGFKDDFHYVNGSHVSKYAKLVRQQKLEKIVSSLEGSKLEKNQLLKIMLLLRIL